MPRITPSVLEVRFFHSCHVLWCGLIITSNPTGPGTVLTDAAWFYSEPKEEAKNIKDHVAFCE